MKRKIPKESIIFRFVILFIIAFIIPLTIFLLLTYRATYLTVKDRAEQDNYTELIKSKAVIEDNVLTCENVSTVVKSMDNFIIFAKGDMLKDAMELIRFRYQEYEQILNIENANPRICSIRFFMDNPDMYEIYGVLYNENRLLDRDKLEDIKKNHYANYVTKIKADIYASKQEDEVAFYTELSDVTGHIGILEVAMTYDVFFEPVFQEDSMDSMALILTEEGTIISNPENKIILEDANLVNSFIQKFVVKDQEIDSKEYWINNKRYWISKADISAIKGTLYQITSFERTEGELKGFRSLIMASILLSGVILLGMIQLTVRKMLGKIQIISQSISQVQSGNLDVVIPIHGKDEIDCLASDYNRMTVELKKMIQRLLEEQDAVRISEMKALQAQIHSHFIYNVLESVRMMAEINKQKEISNTIARLGLLMRYSVSWQDREIPLKLELQMVQGYVELINVISDNPVNLILEVDESIMDCPIPKMSIQPLVENCVNHGFEPLGKNGTIHINGTAKEEGICIEILDNGIGIELATLHKIQKMLEGKVTDNFTFSNTGIGLANVNMRLKLQYGLMHPLEVHSIFQKYTKVTLLLPMKK